MALRSDAYRLTDDDRLELEPSRNGVPPNIVLDSAHYKLVDQLDAALGKHVPSLLQCQTLTIEGPVTFQAGTTIKGNVTIKNPSNAPALVPAGTHEDVTLDL